MSLSHIANQLNGLQVTGTPAKQSQVPVVNSVLRQAIEQHIPTGNRHRHDIDIDTNVSLAYMGGLGAFSHGQEGSGSLKISRRNPCSPFLSASLYVSERGAY